jgi:hypothetical protein
VAVVVVVAAVALVAIELRQMLLLPKECNIQLQ